MTRLTYQTYLRLDELLGQQVPASAPPAHDELLFITVHQTYELWFKLLLHELTDARDQMLTGQMHWACLRLGRCHTIERHLVGAVDVIDCMTPQDFLAFRDALGSASGFQSAQFREIEFLSGAKDPGYLRHPWLSAAERGRLSLRLAEPSLWDAYLHLLSAQGFATSSPPERLGTLCTIAQARDTYPQLWSLAEALVTHDQSWRMWLARHALMVDRQIGIKPGTGGSTGGSYLRSRLDTAFYPELWELRAAL